MAILNHVDPLDRLRSAGRRVTDPFETLAQRVAERVLELIVSALDVNALLERVDVNALLGRVDVNTLLDRVDVAGTAVVYACDARAARLRFLAREAEPGTASPPELPGRSSP